MTPIPLPRLEGIGPLGTGFDITTPTGSLALFETIVSIALGVITIVAGLWFIMQIFSGALQWLGSGGEKQALQNAQKHITNAILGLFIVVISYTLIALVGKVFGLDILGPASIITNSLWK